MICELKTIGSRQDPLSVIPMNALEPNGQNKLLLVGRWYETDIQFSVGTPVLNDDGTQQSWISEKVVYEGKIKINEPLFFSLTIPEDTARSSWKTGSCPTSATVIGMMAYPITSPPAMSFWSWLRPENLCAPASCQPSALRWQSPA